MPRGEHHRPSVRKQVPRRAGRRDGKDFTLYALRDGEILFKNGAGKKKYVSPSASRTGPPTSLERPRERIVHAESIRRGRVPLISVFWSRRLWRFLFYTHTYTYIYIEREREKSVL